MSTDQVHGVTPPMNTSLPTDPQLRVTDSLIEELRREKTFESPEGEAHRIAVIDSLKRIATAFVKHVARAKEPKNEVLIRNAIGKVFNYGSFRLGVYGPGSDMDTLVVAPRYVTRDDYFEYFPKMLVEMAPKNAITDLTAVSDAFVPIIKFEYEGVSIDLIFSRIMQKELPHDLENLKDSGLLRGLDEAELRSLNGTRVTDEILELVPEQTTFKQALRAIKLWAQRRAVYANIMGFPGGVAWAMLVARVCQLYPKATASVVVNKFFLVFGQWPWPQPVLLKPIENGPLPVRVWNPKVYKGDQFHLMPVITPAYPSMCATFNITKSSMAIIQRELKRGLDLTEQIMEGKKPWSDLFVKHTFFTSGYKYYISVIACSKTSEAHQIWAGYVESKVRMLVQKLEQHPLIALAHPFIKGFERTHHCLTSQDIEEVQEGSLSHLVKSEPPDLKHEIPIVQDVPPMKIEEGTCKTESTVTAVKEEDVDTKIKDEDPEQIRLSNVQEAGQEQPTNVYTTTHYIGIELVAKRPRQQPLDLSSQVDEFKSLCTSWQKYEEDLKGLSVIGVQHVRSFDLPDDVFVPGEMKPQKKSAVARTGLNGKKREATEDNPPPAKRQQSSIAAAG